MLFCMRILRLLRRARKLCCLTFTVNMAFLCTLITVKSFVAAENILEKLLHQHAMATPLHNATQRDALLILMLM